jgi:hypothetical protein
MEMDVFPHATLPLPNAGFLKTGHTWLGVRSYTLVEAHISDQRHIAHDPDARLAHRRGMRPAGATEAEIKAVKLEALDKLASRLRFKSGEAGVAEDFIGSPVALGDGFEEPLIELKKLLNGIGAHGTVSKNCLPRQIIEQYL